MFGLPNFVVALSILCGPHWWMTGAEAKCLEVAACSCEANPNGVVVNCRSQNLDHVPTFKAESSDLVYYELTLDTNAIRVIQNNAFSEVRMKRLVLTNNPIQNISQDAFAGLEADLTELLLQIDQSVAFPVSALSKLRQLETLSIVGYGAEALPQDALTSLSSLTTLSLTSGGLRTLSPSDFSVAQRPQISRLNLYYNRFQQIPTSAVSVLTVLSELYMDLNQITNVGRAAFEGASKLWVLDLARNPISQMDLEAFTGLEGTLRNLSLQSCHLSNEHLKAIIPLSSLVYLDISDNSLVQVSEVLPNMRHLEVLKATRNRISSLKKNSYLSVSNSLKILHLEENPLADVAHDTFNDLTSLQELYLDSAQSLELNASSFSSQRNTLQLLSLRSVANLPASPWPAVSELFAARTLWMSSCRLRDVPDFAFIRMPRLGNLDLNNNTLSRLTQRSLAGLSNSLVRLYLSGNNLRTLDECVFHKFSKLDLLQLQLNNNPLECDCALKWLHDRLRPFKQDPGTQFRVMSLQWKCANLNGKLFNTLTDEDFNGCDSAVQCENLDDVTLSQPAFSVTPSPAVTATPGDKPILGITDIAYDGILVVWTVPSSNVVDEFTLTYIADGRPVSIKKLSPDTTQYKLTGLVPQTSYIVCLDVIHAGNPVETTCANTTTTASPEPNMLPVILAASLAATGCVVIIVVVVALVICFRNRKPREQHEPRLVRSPTVGRQSRRYRKTKDQDTALTEVGDTPEMALLNTLGRMTNEEKDRVVNLLTSSMNSLDDLDRKSSFRYVGAQYGRIQPLSTSSQRSRHEYDEIRDSYYDEIKVIDEDTNDVELGGATARLETREGESTHQTNPN